MASLRLEGEEAMDSEAETARASKLPATFVLASQDVAPVHLLALKKKKGDALWSICVTMGLVARALCKPEIASRGLLDEKIGFSGSHLPGSHRGSGSPRPAVAGSRER